MNSPTPRIVPKQPKKAIYVKVQYDDAIKKITGTTAREEQGPGSLVVFDGLDVVARFWSNVERWWIEES
jgi:hypothetical protein